MGPSCREPAVELHWALASCNRALRRLGARGRPESGGPQVKMSKQDSENSPGALRFCPGLLPAPCCSSEKHTVPSLATLRACQKCWPHSFGRVCVTRHFLRRETRVGRFQPPFSLPNHTSGALCRAGSPNSDSDSEKRPFVQRPPAPVRSKLPGCQRLPAVRCWPKPRAGLQTLRPCVS